MVNNATKFTPMIANVCETLLYWCRLVKKLQFMFEPFKIYFNTFIAIGHLVNDFRNPGKNLPVQLVGDPLQVESQGADVRGEKQFHQFVGLFVNQYAIVML